MKKKVLVICLVFIFVFCAIFGISNLGKEEVLRPVSSNEKIFEKMTNKEDVLLYITDTFDNCYLCPDCKPIIDFYGDAYDLEFFIYNKSKNSEEDFTELMAKFDFQDVKIVAPAVIMIKDGIVKGVANEIVNEIMLKQLLINFGFISEKSGLRDYQVFDDEFDEMLNSSEKNIFVMYSYNQGHYKIRKKVLKFSDKYNFNYALIYSGVGKTKNTTIFLKNKLGDNYDLPLIIITQNGKIVDYISFVDEKEMIGFLRKNEII